MSALDFAAQRRTDSFLLMPEQHQNIRLNEILIRILRGLLQYSGECWPWSSASQDGEHAAIQNMVVEQQEDVHQLSSLLDERGHFIDFGTYPTEYTDLHFVSLDYLLDELVAEQTDLVADLDRAVSDCRDDPPAQELLQSIVPSAIAHLERLRELAAARTAGNSAS